MKKLSSRDIKAMTLLSIVVPISLLITFRLTGVLPEPEGPVTIAETVNLETVKWEIERPAHDLDIEDKIENTYDVEGTFLFSLYAAQYYIDHPGPGNDYLGMVINVGANLSKGFVKSLHAVFREDYEKSLVFLGRMLTEPPTPQFENLSLVDLAHYGDSKLEGNEKAFFTAIGVDKPANIQYTGWVEWVQRSPDNQTHRMEILFEVVHYNGTIYRKIVQPFELKIGPDDNNSFETAYELKPGSYKGYISIVNDPVDYYKVWIEQNSTIDIRVEKPPQGVIIPLFDLLLYDSDKILKKELDFDSFYNGQSLSYTADSTGFWYIEARYSMRSSGGFYTLGLDIYSP